MAETKPRNEAYLGVAWKHTDKSGKTFLSCVINKEVENVPKSFMLFANTHKRAGKKDPDYNIVKARDREL